MGMDLHNLPHLERRICLVCNGSRKLYEEHPDGSLSEHVCPYCHGTGNSAWIRERFNARISKQEMIKGAIAFYWVFVLASNGWTFWSANALEIGGWRAWLVLVHFLVWVTAIVGAVWWFTHPKPSKRRRRQRRPDPLTTNEERLMIGGVIGAAVVKHELGDLKARWDATGPK